MTTAFAIRDAKLADAPALAALFVEAWRDEHAGLLPEAVLAERSREESETNWRRSLRRARRPGHDPSVLIAGSGPLPGLIVGELAAAEWPGAAEVMVIQVARSSRRQGLGTALMRRIAARLRRKGAQAIIVRVLEANERARRFYEALGGELAPAVREIDESGVSFVERTYVWPDISRLVRAKA